MPAEMKRAGHLVAATKGTKGKRILLLGHIDTVLRGESSGARATRRLARVRQT
jgi:glutamate carboxypeptidase